MKMMNLLLGVIKKTAVLIIVVCVVSIVKDKIFEIRFKKAMKAQETLMLKQNIHPTIRGAQIIDTIKIDTIQ